jgi:hypothetical protein
LSDELDPASKERAFDDVHAWGLRFADHASAGVDPDHLVRVSVSDEHAAHDHHGRFDGTTHGAARLDHERARHTNLAIDFAAYDEVFTGLHVSYDPESFGQKGRFDHHRSPSPTEKSMSMPP